MSILIVSRGYTRFTSCTAKKLVIANPVHYLRTVSNLADDHREWNNLGLRISGSFRDLVSRVGYSYRPLSLSQWDATVTNGCFEISQALAGESHWNDIAKKISMCIVYTKLLTPN